MRRFLLLLTLTSCANGADEISPAAYYEQHASAVCELHFRCCDDAAIARVLGMLFTPPPVTQQECELYYADVASITLPALDTSVDAGRARFDQDAAIACVEELRAVGCDDWFGSASPGTLIPACADVVVPLVADGGACTNSIECESGVCVNRACAAPNAVGAPCPATSPLCVDGAYCSEAKTCVAQVGEGSPCAIHADCTTGNCDAGACAPPLPREPVMGCEG